MEGLTRLVSESLARHGFDRPLDYRRLHWSRWFRCESHHSLLFVPSKPGVFALAEEIMDLSAHVGTDAFVRPATLSEAKGSAPVWDRVSDPVRPSNARQDSADTSPEAESRKPEAISPRRMLAVTQFFEDDDMAFVLDRMLSRHNPMSARLASGRYFVRFVVIEDQSQRRSICSALNQWMASSAEKVTGIGPHFATSLELTPANEYVPQPDDRQQSLFAPHVATNESVWDRVSDPVKPSHARQDLAATNAPVGTDAFVRPASEASGSVEERPFRTASGTTPASPQLDSGAATNIHCPSPFPSGF